MDLKLIVNRPWEVLPHSSTPQPSPTASTSAAANLANNAELRDVDFRKPVLVPVRKLYLNSEQGCAIQALYTGNAEYRMRFNATALSQAEAERVLRENGLPQPTRPQSGLGNCWLTAWSSTWGSRKGKKKRSLFQCSSGYNTAARQARDKRGSQNPVEWSRQADYEFTGCLAHADVTWNCGSGEIERVIGYFKHSERCQAAVAIRSASAHT